MLFTLNLNHRSKTLDLFGKVKDNGIHIYEAGILYGKNTLYLSSYLIKIFYYFIKEGLNL